MSAEENLTQMVAESCILTIDQGTTRQKVALFDSAGVCIGQGSTRNEEYADDHGHRQRAESWWQSAAATSRALLTEHDVEVCAIAVSGRAGAGVGINAAGRVSCDPWLDRRHGQQQKTYQERWPDLANYGAALIAKLDWHRQHRREPVRKMMYAKDFLVYRLCGECVTDPSSGPDAGHWPDEVLSTLSIEGELPRILMPWDVAGELLPNAADTLGIPRGTPVVVGAHDGICANVGAGALTSDRPALTLGTHGVTRAIVGDSPTDAMYRFYQMPPGGHVIGANAYMAGRSLDWILDQTHPPHIDRAGLFSDMDDWLIHQGPGARGARFFPYLEGQISPLRRPRVRASFSELTAAHGPKELFQAVMEGASYAIAESALQVFGWVGKPNRLCATGSGAQSRVWPQIIANVLNVPLEITDGSSEGRGAAVFAAMALGWHATLEDAVAEMVRPGHLVEADSESALHQSLFASWCEASSRLPDAPIDPS